MLGISIYPEQMTVEDAKAYLQLAYHHGYRRVFTSLLQVDVEGTQLADFRTTMRYAKTLGMKVIVDINPTLFTALGIQYDDLSFFADIGAWGLRLDEGFTGYEEAKMTYNEFGLKIEINMSAGTNYVYSIMSYAPNRDNLIGCHNFYPQALTGLSDQYFCAYSQPYRDLNLHTAAFVSVAGAPLGPWPVREGLPTRESDRHRALASQVQSLKLTGMVDDIIIGNAPANADALEEVAQAFFAPCPVLPMSVHAAASKIERTILFKNKHLYRGDASAYLIRDTQPRLTYADAAIPPHDCTGEVLPGDILVVNEAYGRYKGELQIAIKAFPNDGRRNVVGRVTDSGLLEQLRPWMTFTLTAE